MNEQEINRYWKKIVNTMSEGFMLVGPDGIILMVNESFEKLTGYSAKEVIGRPCTILRCDACDMTLKSSGRSWCKLFAEGQVLKRHCLLRVKNGSYVPALKNASVLKDETEKILGAVETLTDLSELERLDQKVELLSRQLEEDTGFHGILGKSAPMQKLFDVVEKAANSEAPVIIYGESGTGKELVARAIHQLGRRRNEAFIQFNCAALNEALLESELFGHIKGAFTGAYRHRQGRFEAANRGDIFLDEIGDVPLSIQVKLLRVLETQQFEHVGDDHPIVVDVRIITATNRNLEELVAQKRFRDDLFFRINVFPIFLPPLRERTEDIPLLVNAFIRKLRVKTGKKITGLSPDALDCFMNFRWPGNVRELKSALEYAFVIAEKGLIDLNQLPANIIEFKGLARSQEAPVRYAVPLDFTMNPLEEKEKTELIQALRQCRGNQTQTARLLGINRVTVWNRIKKYRVDLKEILS
jgi:two-component system, NtrC family, response regulator HydG